MSSAAVSVMIYTTVVIVVKAAVHVASGGAAVWDDVKMFDWGIEAFFAVPIMVFAFHCHVQVCCQVLT